MEQKNVIDIIDTHIDKIKIESKDPGWSTWALILVFCSTIYLIYKDWCNFEGSPNVVLVLAYAEYNILDFICNLFFTKKQPNSGNQLFIKPAEDAFSLSIRRAILLIIYVLFFAIVVYNYNLSNVIKVGAYIHISAIGILAAIHIAFSKFNIPIVISKKRKNNTFYKICWLFFLILPLAISSYILYSETHGVEKELELSTLISIELIVFYFIIKTTEKNKTLHNLFQLKIDLLYERITPTEALNRLEIITFGLRLNKIMEKEVEIFISAIHDIEDELRQANNYAEKLTLLKNNEDSKISEDAFYDAIYARIKTSKEKMKNVFKCYNKLQFKLTTIVNQAENSQEPIEIEDMLHREIKKIVFQLDKLEPFLSNCTKTEKNA